MKLIQPKAELLIQEPGLFGVNRQIERCARICYKSEDKITEGSAQKMIDNLIMNNHTAMLEHGTVYLKFDNEQTKEGYHGANAILRYKDNPYSKISYSFKEKSDHAFAGCLYITTNFRVLFEQGYLDDIKYICEPTEYHEKRYTFKLTTDRGVSHELVRHRVFSFAQESQRYCNYSKDKFGKELTFIEPSWKDDDNCTANYVKLKRLCGYLEEQYLEMIEWGATPQQARAILPNSTKTEICMTGFASDWKHFFELRLLGITGKPHPDMVHLATLMKEEAEKHNIWQDIYHSYQI